MTKEINTDAELIGRLLTTRPTPAECLVSAARIEQLTEDRDRLRETLERIAGVKGPYSHPFPESNEGYGSFAIVTAREALKGETP